MVLQSVAEPPAAMVTVGSLNDFGEAPPQALTKWTRSERTAVAGVCPLLRSSTTTRICSPMRARGGKTPPEATRLEPPSPPASRIASGWPERMSVRSACWTSARRWGEAPASHLLHVLVTVAG